MKLQNNMKKVNNNKEIDGNVGKLKKETNDARTVTTVNMF